MLSIIGEDIFVVVIAFVKIFVAEEI